MDMNIPYTVEERPDTGLTNGKLGIWLFLASEVMLFGALFSTYIILRMGAPEWPHGELNVWLGMANTFILIGSSVTMVMAWASLKLNDFGKHRIYLLATVAAVGGVPGQQVLRVRGALGARRAAGQEHVPGDLLHADRAARHPHPRRDRRDAVFPRTGREALQEESRSSSPTASSTPGSTGTSSTWCGSSCSRFCICCRRSSHDSDQESIRQSRSRPTG